MLPLPVIKPCQVIEALKKVGFSIHHQTGSHVRMLHKTKPELRLTIPSHNKDIPKGTLANILRLVNITIEEFINYLKN